MVNVPHYDCQRCGACCYNRTDNAQEGYIDYVAIRADDSILGRKDLVKKFVRYADDGTPHLKLLDDGRCKALAGALGKYNRCTIYEHRPTPCRKVQAGSALCLEYRRDKGL